MLGDHRRLAVQRIAEGIDNAAEECVAYGDIHDSTRASHLVAYVEALVFAQQDYAYFILIYIECHPKAIAWKGHEFFVAYVRQSGDCRDSRRKAGDDANLVGF
jgi:hypothetical protein